MSAYIWLGTGTDGVPFSEQGLPDLQVDETMSDPVSSENVAFGDALWCL